MRQTMSLRSRRDLVGVSYVRYQKASPPQKKAILDEFVAATGYHRKYALQLLLHPPQLKPLRSQSAGRKAQPIKRSRKRQYGPAVKQSLISAWKAANCICTKRLIPFLPEFIEALQKHGEFPLEPHVQNQLLKMSVATADRLLRSERKSLQPHGKCTTKPGTLLKSQIPIRTFADWNENQAGFLEIDLVAHCDDDVSGEFLYSLVMTDVATGWTECIAVGSKGQACVFAGIEKGRVQLPFPLLGIDSDNGSEFINGHLCRYCKEEEIIFTRCRPYKKNDQCHVEQKNWSIVRRMVGYDRYEGKEALQALSALYNKLRLYQNYFQPCMKLISKVKVNTNNTTTNTNSQAQSTQAQSTQAQSTQAQSTQAQSTQAGGSTITGSTITGSRVKKKYDQAKTPYRRVLDLEQVSQESKDKLRKEYEQINPKALLTEVHTLQERLWSRSKHCPVVKEA